MKIWITRYALSHGIDLADGEKVSNLSVRTDDWRWFYENDWYESSKEAISRAEEMRAKKISSLKKQISRLEKLDFQAQVEKAEAKYHAE